MKYIVLFLLIIAFIWSQNCKAQNKSYEDRDVCTDTMFHKGKINHGKPYCVAWATIRHYKTGKLDTIAYTFSSRGFFVDEYEAYKNLSERGKYIVDSLKEDGITQFQDLYLVYEPMYMKIGSKKEWLWRIESNTIKMYQYLFWNNTHGNGIRLIKEIEVN